MMRLKCNSCGAETSLDALVDNDDAARVLNLALNMTPLGKLLVKYLSLFRPKSTRLSWSKVAKLLGELLPMIEAQRFERGGVTYEAPQAVWCSAIESMLDMRDQGKLTLPMKSHGYLFDVMSTHSTRAQVALTGETGLTAWGNKTATAPQSATAKAVLALEKRKRGS